MRRCCRFVTHGTPSALSITGGGERFFSFLFFLFFPSSIHNDAPRSRQLTKRHVARSNHPDAHHSTLSYHSNQYYLRNNCVFTWNVKRQKVKKMAALDGHTSICECAAIGQRREGRASIISRIVSLLSKTLLLETCGTLSQIFNVIYISQARRTSFLFYSLFAKIVTIFIKRRM